MFGLLSYVQNLIFSSEDNDLGSDCSKEDGDLWNELDEKADDILERLHIEELCKAAEQNEYEEDFLEGAPVDDSDCVQYSVLRDGVITAVKKDGGVINNVYLCRSEDILPHIIQVGDHVQFRTVTNIDDEEEGLFVKVEKILPKDSQNALEVIPSSQLLGKSFELDRKITGTITEKRVSSLIVDFNHCLNLSVVKCDFILEVGDKVCVECSADVATGQIKEYKYVKPANRKFFTHCVITHYNEEMGVGIVLFETKNERNIEIAFSKSVSRPGYLPAINDMVCVDAMESDQELFAWRAINLDLEKRAEEKLIPKDANPLATHEGLTAKCISENKFNMENARSEYIKIEFRNSSTKERQLVAVRIDNQCRDSGHLISQLRTLRPNHPQFVKFPCVVPANKYVQFTMEVIPKFFGKSLEKVKFTLDDQAELRVPIELEMYLVGLNNTNQRGPRRYQRKKQYTSEEICFRDSLQNVIKGVRPNMIGTCGMKFQSVRMGPYDIPHRLIVTCRGTHADPIRSHQQAVERLQKDYGVLYEQLSEENYMSKFHTCLYLEEIYLMAHMANLDIKKGSLRHAGEYLALYVVGLMESRPSLIIGDRVYASVPENVNIKDKATYEGYIHSIRHEELYIKFTKAFHDSYRGETYAFRFVHTRTQFRRFHHVLDDISKPKLGIAWLFPRTIQEKAPVVHIVSEDQPDEPPECLNQKPEQLVDKLRIFSQHVNDIHIDPVKSDENGIEVKTEQEEEEQETCDETVQYTEDNQIDTKTTPEEAKEKLNDESPHNICDSPSVNITSNVSNENNLNVSPIISNENNLLCDTTPICDQTVEVQADKALETQQSNKLAKELELYNKILNPDKNPRRRVVISPPKTGATTNQTAKSGADTPKNEVSKRGESEQNKSEVISHNVEKEQNKSEARSNHNNGVSQVPHVNNVTVKSELGKQPAEVNNQTMPKSIENDQATMSSIASVLQDTTNIIRPPQDIAPVTVSPKGEIPHEVNWGKTKQHSEINWVRDFAGMGAHKSNTSKPNTSLTNIPSREKELRWFNRTLNWYQKAAVRNILRFEARPLPYVIFGPPGTGKTVTVTETILQLYTLIPECRILLATPNNASADLLAERLIESGQFQIGDLVRLLSFTYLQAGSVPSSIAPYCCTPAGYFTHCVIDEAGQATEPEVLVPISLLHRDNGHVVLAGDPLQLGPTVFSKLGQQLELRISLLERLTGRFLYSRDMSRFYATGGYDPRLVTRLVNNYRTMPEILKISSDLFYDASLVPHVTLEDYEGLILRKLSKVLPPRSQAPYPSPILFHGVQGDNAQDNDSPSWYNSTEAVVVIGYLKKLYDAGLQPDQIGIITPYRKQIRSIITGCGIPEPKVASIEEFQGQERLVIIVSTVRSLSSSSFLPKDIEQCLGFIGLPTRLNVAVTRARALLLIVGDPNLLGEDLYWAKIIAYIRSIGGYTGCIPSNPKLNW
ncbi:hypothetical protein M8J76_005035 [Diaphorina citri]|nr:hypothetical protein M8J76_000796 [Diaphorina citri]KAI5749158.1 hypothetical protein M8J76_005035 [Diaphorina citri]